MTERIPKGILLAGILVPVLLAYFAYSRPWYFSDQTYLGRWILLEFLIAAVWMYRRAFFPLVIVSFLLAGANLPVGSVWTTARWLILAVGALFGSFIAIKERRYPFGIFHIAAVFVILTALLSATVSRYPTVALLKVLSFFLLFLYAGTGARIAVNGRENIFFSRLLWGCEIFVGLNAVFYGLSIEAMGNPNSLGAAMGVVAAPLLLWGMLVAEEPSLRRRRGILFTIAMSLDFLSHSRAGLAAAFVSCGLLCISLRQHRLLVKAIIITTMVLAGVAILRPEEVAMMTSSIVYKGAEQEQGIFLSRQTPWHDAIESIREHPWFGSGLGTTADGGAPTQEQANYSSTSAVTAEHGSSYLAFVAGVGIIGLLPVIVLLGILVRRIFHTVNWLRNYGIAAHPAVPLAFIILAGIVHALFEDWMAAAGSYLSVFFWAIAFVFVDKSLFLKTVVPRASWNLSDRSRVPTAILSTR